MPAPVGHVHVSEREAPPWICCTPCSGLMFFRLAHGIGKPATLAEAHEIRKAAGVPHSGGMNYTALRTGLANRYGWKVPAVGSGFTDFWTVFVPGTVAVLSGSYAAFSAGHRLRRFDPAFTGGHSVFVARYSGAEEAWWDDPLAPTGSYAGERVTKAELKTFAGAWNSTHIVAPLGGGDMLPITDLTPKFMSTPAGLRIYNLSGALVETLVNSYGERLSPYAVTVGGTSFRVSVYQSNGVRQVLLVKPGDVKLRDVPADSGITQADLAAAVLAAQQGQYDRDKAAAVVITSIDLGVRPA